MASRRLLAHCDLLRSISPSPAAQKARRWLKRRLKALSALRDIQVQRSFVESHLTAFPELVLMRDFLEERERRLARAAAADLCGLKLGKLEQWIVGVLRDLGAETGDVNGRDDLSSAVFRIAHKTYAEVVRRRRAIDLNDLRTIHRTRLGFKKFRYVMEGLSPGITGLNKRQLRSLAGYQRRMGLVQDLEIMLRCVAGFVDKHQAAEESLEQFRRHLQQRCTRAVSSFARSADKLYSFWPADWRMSDPDFDFAWNAA